jgi:hypothetical protein
MKKKKEKEEKEDYAWRGRIVTDAKEMRER